MKCTRFTCFACCLVLFAICFSVSSAIHHLFGSLVAGMGFSLAYLHGEGR